MNHSVAAHVEFDTPRRTLFWLHLAIGIALLSLAAAMDLAKPFGKSWTIFYLLPMLYVGWKIRDGRIEVPFYIAVFATTFLVPLIFHRQLLLGGTGIFNRSLGSLVGMLVIFLIWERRRYVGALERANEDLEQRVATRVQELQRANDELAVDIEQRQQAEQQLRDSEARFRTFVDHATDAFFLHDENGIVRDVNQQACESLGYERAELVGMSPRQFDPMLTVQQVEQITQRLHAGETLQFDSVHRRKDGSEFPVEIRIRPFLSQGKRFRVALAHDISERKITEAELRESEQRFRQLSDAAFEGLMIHEQGVIRDANRAFADLFAIPSVEEMIGRPGLDVISLTPESTQTIRDQLRSPKESGVLEISTQRPDGTIRVLETQSNPILFQGRPARVVAVRDVTERKQAEAELRESEQRFRQFSDSSFEGLLIHKQGIICDANRAFAELFGLGSVKEMMGRHCLDVFPLTPESRETLREQLRSPRECVIELSTHRPDGTRRFFETQSRQILLQGGVGRVVTVRDVTERKQAEERRRELSEQMQQAQTLESLGVMAGGIAHDFNNLLTVINGNSHLLRTKLDENDPRLSFAVAIQAAGSQAAKLMRQLMMFSRGIPQQPEVLDIRQIIEHSFEIWQKVVGKGIVVVVDCADELWPVMADRSQIEQVLLNLVLNARDALPQGGSITITASNLELPLATREKPVEMEMGHGKAGRFVRISVEDTGVGMSEKVRARIFEPFFTTKNVGEGTGLGLPMCHGIVRQTGGWIEVHSEPSRGSTFSVVLPSYTQTRQGPTEAREEAAAAGSR